MRQILFGILFLYATVSFSQSNFNVYLIGGGTQSPNERGQVYEQILSEASAEDFLIFYGFDHMSSGLVGKEDPLRTSIETRYQPAVEFINAFKGRSFILKSKGDWGNRKKDGWQKAKNLETYLKLNLNERSQLVPQLACPGPLEIHLDYWRTLVIIDTEYFLHPYEKPGEAEGCGIKSTSDALIQLNDIVTNNSKKHLLVAGYQTINSENNLFSNPRYRLLKKALLETLGQSENIIYASGDGMNAQYAAYNQLHLITNGNFGANEVQCSEVPTYETAEKGFTKLTYKGDGAVELAMMSSQKGKTFFEQTLYKKELEPLEDMSNISFPQTKVLPISDKYDSASDSRKFFLGENYRDVWSTPVEMKVFDIGTEHGGLSIIKMGGGNQTKSLRLKDKDGKQYVLRSLDKYTDKLLPAAMQRTIASDILQDQISGANPWGAFAVPHLADAAGVHHTNPQIVYIPDDPRFGDYRNIFAGLVCLYEERPTSKVAQDPHFGSGKKVIGTPDLIEKLHNDNDESVDQSFALRSRLFDMFLADWDRHEDQWRWVSHKDEHGHYWQPIPRDRDQAFFKGEGTVGWFASRRFVLPNTEGFREKMRYPPGYNASPRFFDRTFLNGLDWEDWKAQIGHLNTALSDEAIEKAIKTWPQEIYDLEGEETIRILKARRDDMLRYAQIHYLFLSREVEVVGTNKHEHFLVERRSDLTTKVTVWKKHKKGDRDQIIYERVFKNEETKEIRLYGLDGEDSFELKGDVKQGIKIRIIGGTDPDKIDNNSNVAGLGKKTIVYDRKKSTEIKSSGDTKVKLSKKPEVNHYNRLGFKYNKLIPIISTEFNPDDGVFLGAGFTYIKNRWRKEPFASKHNLAGNIAVATGAFHLYYNGIFTDAISKLDLEIDLSFQRPFGVTNFFGLGNESTYDFEGDNIPDRFDDPIDFYRFRYQKSCNSVNLIQNLSEKITFSYGAKHLFVDVKRQTNRFINQSMELGENDFKTHQYLAGATNLTFDFRDNPNLPTRGVYANISYDQYFGINNVSEDFGSINGELKFYVSTRIPSKVTIANRVGAQHITTETPFFNQAMLGRGLLRGYRRDRFIGETAFYHNIDLRLKLFSFRTYVFPGSFGLTGFHDIGRVWQDGENSTKWHSSKGFGVWVAPLNQIAINAVAAFSEEETQVLVKFGFFF